MATTTDDKKVIYSMYKVSKKRGTKQVLKDISLSYFYGGFLMRNEGQVRIPSGCAISGIIDKSGRRMSGEAIIKSISVMHDRSNGLGGGFAAYGIYPEYKDYYALHLFYESVSAKRECEEFLERHFDIINLSKIPTRKIKENVKSFSNGILT
ncbi:hypothetical protein [Treponema sp. R6D11]